MRLHAPRQHALLLGLAVALGCGPDPAFICETDQQCPADADGQCEPDGFCSIADAVCESGRRYTELADQDKADACVPTQEATGTSTGTAETTGGDDFPDVPAESAGGPDDPYGRCTPGCAMTDAVCLENGGGKFQMCAPPCSDPSDSCPTPLGGVGQTRCLDTGATVALACFVECSDNGNCPNGMVCAGAGVCSWSIEDD